MNIQMEPGKPYSFAYDILEAPTPRELVMQVVAAFRGGLLPLGGVAVIGQPGIVGSVRYVQAVGFVRPAAAEEMENPEPPEIPRDGPSGLVV